jgi:hypothetical protein
MVQKVSTYFRRVHERSGSALSTASDDVDSLENVSVPADMLPVRVKSALLDLFNCEADERITSVLTKAGVRGGNEQDIFWASLQVGGRRHEGGVFRFLVDESDLQAVTGLTRDDLRRVRRVLEEEEQGSKSGLVQPAAAVASAGQEGSEEQKEEGQSASADEIRLRKFLATQNEAWLREAARRAGITNGPQDKLVKEVLQHRAEGTFDKTPLEHLLAGTGKVKKVQRTFEKAVRDMEHEHGLAFITCAEVRNFAATLPESAVKARFLRVAEALAAVL